MEPRSPVLSWKQASVKCCRRGSLEPAVMGAAAQAWSLVCWGLVCVWGQASWPVLSTWAWCLPVYHFAAVIMRPLLYARARSWYIPHGSLYNSSPRSVLFITLHLQVGT